LSTTILSVVGKENPVRVLLTATYSAKVFRRDIFRSMNQKLKPFLMRLHPDTRVLVEKAAADQRRSLSSVIDQAVRDQLQPRYGELQPRLQRFLSGVKQP
jgi:hypothetical protein